MSYRERESRREQITIELPRTTVDLLRVIGEPAQVLATLADHAQQGVYRPGSWERPWLEQVFGAAFTSKLERDPDAPYFDRPRRD